MNTSWQHQDREIDPSEVELSQEETSAAVLETASKNVKLII